MSVLVVIATPLLFFLGPLTGDGEVVAIYNRICSRSYKENRLFIELLLFSLLVEILLVEEPCVITIISRSTPFILIVVTGHVGC